MDWNSSLRTLVSRPGPDPSFNFLYNYNYDQFPGMEVKHPNMGEAYPGMEKIQYYCGNSQERKKRLTSDQLDSLERSFQEEIKLDPDRKMKLSRDLGLQPRQIAIWFQNRRARWKAKQLERLYDALKLEYDAVSKEKQKLQEEVMKLRAMLRDEATGKPLSTDISGDETVESTSVATRIFGRIKGNTHHQQPIPESNNVLSVDEYNIPVVSSPYWPLPVLPSFPSSN